MTFPSAASAATVWPELRSMRANPPGGSASGERRRVFASSLEQAEQLFRAAADVGYASRPLLLFYGLSQAGRAIAAAATAAGKNDWQLSGHGIEVSNLMGRPPLHELRVADRGLGSFTRLAALLDSGSLPDGAELGQVWLSIPDLLLRPIGGGAARYAPAVLLDIGHSASADRIFGTALVMGTNLPELRTAAEVGEFLAQYPALAAAEPQEGLLVVPSDTAIQVRIALPYEEPYDLDRIHWQYAAPYTQEDDWWAYPAVGGADRPLNPLMAWWAMLFTLSMLARYEPASWTSHINVDESAEAVAVETALDRALDVCPVLLLRAIRAVS